MKLELVSMRPKIGEKKTNISTMKTIIQKSTADLIAFGEMTLTGYKCKDEIRSLAETIHGSSLSSLKEIAHQEHKHIIFGMPLKDEKLTGIIHNAAILLHPDGTIDTYKKWFLPTFGPFEEKLYFDEGETLPVFSTPFGTIGIQICYDIFFPEITKALALQGADLIICISASPSVTRSYFETILPARAIETTTYIAYTNIVGPQEDLVFWGGSQIYDPFGKQIKKAPYFKETSITTEIKQDQLKQARANRPVLRDIRSEIYLDLYQHSRYHKKIHPNYDSLKSQ